jgi:hypothetical protein
MNARDRHRAEVLWQNAKDSKVARKEIAGMTAKHKDAGTTHALRAL